jgi:hypothetical protein
MRIKKVSLLFIMFLLAIVLLSVSCSNNNEEAVETDNSCLSGFFLDLGYENCLMCHGSSDNNLSKNLSWHCLHLDPIAYVNITDIDYSPSLNDCLLCHTSHLPGGVKIIYNCAPCHFG